MITKETLEGRLSSLQKDKERTLALAATLDGAIQECKYWLSQVDQVDTEGGM